MKEWSQFKAADRSMCVGVSSQGEVDPIYSELVTCLEMAADNHGGDTSNWQPQGAMYNSAPSVVPPPRNCMPPGSSERQVIRRVAKQSNMAGVVNVPVLAKSRNRRKSSPRVGSFQASW